MKFRVFISTVIVFALISYTPTIVFAQTITQDTYDRLNQAPLEGLIDGIEDARSAFMELSTDVSLAVDTEWNERWYNAEFLIGWHSAELLKIDSPNEAMITLQSAVNDVVDGYDLIDEGIKTIDADKIEKGVNLFSNGRITVIAAYTALMNSESVVTPNIKPPARPTAKPTVIPTAKPTKLPTPLPSLPPVKIGLATPTAVISTTAPITTTLGITISVTKASNLRSGPGTNYAIVGGSHSGDILLVVATNKDKTWLKTKNGEWIAAFLVNLIPVGLPIE